jgi:hypothetical protein
MEGSGALDHGRTGGRVRGDVRGVVAADDCSLPHCSEKVFHSWVRDGIRDVYLRFVKSSAVVAHKAA